MPINAIENFYYNCSFFFKKKKKSLALIACSFEVRLGKEGHWGTWGRGTGGFLANFRVYKT